MEGCAWTGDSRRGHARPMCVILTHNLLRPLTGPFSGPCKFCTTLPQHAVELNLQSYPKKTLQEPLTKVGTLSFSRVKGQIGTSVGTQWNASVWAWASPSCWQGTGSGAMD